MKKNIFKSFVWFVIIFSLVACAKIKGTGKDVGHAARDATKKIGKASKDTVKTIGKETKEAVDEIKK